MTYTTQTRKSLHGGWVAETYIKLQTITETKTAFLKISTTKGYTNASYLIQETGGVFVSEVFEMFSDYNKTVSRNTISRATAKTVEEAHKAALELVPEHLAAVKVQYSL